MRFLCISDIHGHRAALDAVLEEAAARDWHQLLVCGDLLFPGPEPLATWKRLVELKAVCTQGIGDRALALIDPDKLQPRDEAERERVARLVQVRRELGELIVLHLRKLPDRVRLPLESGDELLVVHGSPADPTEAFTHEMSDAELNALVADEAADVIVCGASHVPFHRQLDGVHIVSVGSVGEAPGGGSAHATLIDAGPTGVSIEQFEVRLP